jgi:hypothetical protein
VKRMVYTSLGAGAGVALCYPTQDRFARFPHQLIIICIGVQRRAGEEDGVQQPGSGGGGRALLSYTGPSPPTSIHVLVGSSVPYPHVLGLPDPDPLLVIGMDPDPAPDPSVIKQ